MQAACEDTWGKCRHEHNEQLRLSYRKLGNYGWKKGNQGKLSMIKWSESGSGYAFSPTKTDTVTQQADSEAEEQQV